MILKKILFNFLMAIILSSSSYAGVCINDKSQMYSGFTTNIRFRVYNYSSDSVKFKFTGQMSSCLYNEFKGENLCSKQLKTGQVAPEMYNITVAKIDNGSKDYVRLPTIRSYGSCNVPGAINIGILSPSGKALSFMMFNIRSMADLISLTRKSAYLKNAVEDNNYPFSVYLMYYNSIYKKENFGTNLINYIANEQIDGGFIQNLDGAKSNDFGIYICDKQRDPANPDPRTCNIPPKQDTPPSELNTNY